MGILEITVFANERVVISVVELVEDSKNETRLF
jgi:hypothetical protein